MPESDARSVQLKHSPTASSHYWLLSLSQLAPSKPVPAPRRDYWPTLLSSLLQHRPHATTLGMPSFLCNCWLQQSQSQMHAESTALLSFRLCDHLVTPAVQAPDNNFWPALLLSLIQLATYYPVPSSDQWPAHFSSYATAGCVPKARS